LSDPNKMAEKVSSSETEVSLLALTAGSFNDLE
jgi:hypothetical protein